MKLSKALKDKLWGETGPYSQAKLIIETRILDDRVSRVFAVVECEINPLTYEIIKQNRDHFKKDKKIQQLLNYSEYRGQEFGYVSMAFQEELVNDQVWKRARLHLDYTKETIIKMHRFVMELLELKSNSREVLSRSNLEENSI